MTPMSGSDDSYAQTMLAPSRRGAITLRHALGSLRGMQHRFDSGTIHLGRRKDCDVQYNSVTDRMVSGRHARLSCTDGLWTIEDLGSTNGTLVNSQSVVGRVQLRHGDCVVLGLEGTDGSASFTVEIQSAESPAPAAPAAPAADFPETGFTYDCPGCGALVPAPLSSIGLYARCLHCGNDHRVPRPGQSAEPAVAKATSPTPEPIASSVRAKEASAPVDAAQVEEAIEQASRAQRRAAADLASVMWHSGSEIDWSRCRSVPNVLATERALQDASSHLDAIDEELHRLEEAHRAFVTDSERRRRETEERLERARHAKRDAENERVELAAEYDTRFTLVVERLDQLSLLIADFVARQRPNAEPGALADLAALRLAMRNEGAALDPEAASTHDVLTRRDDAERRVVSRAEEIAASERLLTTIAKEGAAHDAQFASERSELQSQLDRASASLAEIRSELSHCFAQLGQEAVENDMPECNRHPQERASYDEATRALRAAHAAREPA